MIIFALVLLGSLSLLSGIFVICACVIAGMQREPLPPSAESYTPPVAETDVPPAILRA